MLIKRKTLAGILLGLTLGIMGTAQKAFALICTCTVSGENPMIIEFNGPTTRFTKCKDANSASISGKRSGQKSTVTITLKSCHPYSGGATVDFKTND